MRRSRPAPRARVAGPIFGLLVLAGSLPAHAAGTLLQSPLVGATPLSAQRSEALATLNASAAAPFRAVVARDGQLRGITGGRLLVPVRPGQALTAERAVSHLLAAHPGVFGVDPTWSFTVTGRNGGRAGVVRFLRDGIAIHGAGGHVAIDDSALVSAALALPPQSVVLGAFAVGRGVAAARARQAVGEIAVARGVTAPAWRDPRAQPRFVASAGGLVPAWIVEESTASGDAFGVIVDARDGSQRKVLELTSRGDLDGEYPYEGSLIPFDTRNAKGKVYKNVKDARKGKGSTRTLTDVCTGLDAMGIPPGLLVGGFADLWSNAGFSPYSEKFNYPYSPFNASTYDLFDQVNVYYHMTIFARHLEKVLGRDLASGFSLPVLCNIADDQPNAFFSPTLFPVDSHTVGWIGFFDLTFFLGPQADLSRDPTVVAHEYTHAWLWFEELGFDGALDDPARAVNEAVADFWALAFHGGNQLGLVGNDVFPGLMRDLQDEDWYPATTVDAMTLTGNLPEEHRNGEIFGSFLMDVAGHLGRPETEQLLFAALPFMPRNCEDAGYPVVNAANALAATEDFFAACAATMAEFVHPDAEFGTIIGAAAARGFLNVPGTDNLVGIDLEEAPGLRMRFDSRFVRTEAEHVYLFKVDPSRSVSITVKGGKGVKPDFTVDGFDMSPGFTETSPKQVKSKGRLVKQTGLVPLLDGEAYYIVTVSTPTGTLGDYALTIQAE